MRILPVGLVGVIAFAPAALSALETCGLQAVPLVAGIGVAGLGARIVG